MNDKSLQYIAIGLFGAVLLVLVMGYLFGWFKKGQLKLVDGEGDVDRLPNGAIDESRYYSIASNAKASLEGINVNTDWFKNVASQLLQLNYNELRVVNNVYKRDLATKDNPTLRTLIQGEMVGFYGICTSGEQKDISSPCYLQVKVLDKLNYINA